MKNSLKWLTRSLLVCTVLFIAVRETQATQITYTLQGTASGCVFQPGSSCSFGVAFNNANLILTLSTDTSLINDNGSFYYTNFSSLPGGPQPGISDTFISLGGFGAGTVSDQPFRVISDAARAGILAFREGDSVHYWLSEHNNLSNGYDLRSPFGPLTGDASTDPLPVLTSFGFVQFSSVGAADTFTARFSSTPEPETWGLVGLGTTVLLGLQCFRRRRVEFRS